MVKNHQHGAIGVNKHGNSATQGSSSPLHVSQSHVKRRRLQTVDDESIEQLLRDDSVACSSSCERICAGLPFAITVEQNGEDLSRVHGTLISLLEDPRCELTGVDLESNEMSSEHCEALASALKAPECPLTTLSMKRMGVGPENAEALAEAIGANNSLTSLNVERNGLAVRGGRALGAGLARNRSLTQLDMSLNDIGPEGGMAVAAALAPSSSLSGLTSLVMVRCGLGPGGGKALGAALAHNVSLISLDLTQNDLGVEGGLAIGAALEANSTLTRLNMRFNRIGFGLERAMGFVRALETNSTLEWLEMAQNELGSIGGRAFGEALRKNTGLTYLGIERNELGCEGCSDIGEALATNATLEELDLAWNELGRSNRSGAQSARACTAFGRALRVNRTLQRLTIAQNDIDTEGAVALCEGLASNPTLAELRMRRNELGATGGEALAAALSSRPAVLEVLDAACNGLGSSGAAFARAAAANPALTSLDLSSNGLGSRDGVALAAAVAEHPALARCDLSDNEITVVPIETQLALGAREPPLHLDLSTNPLSSPPLGGRADAETLLEYLQALHSESAQITRLRLMVCGFGGVGKTTFCTAATTPPSELPHFHSSLTPCTAWDAPTIAHWLRVLLPISTAAAAEWCEAAAAALEAGGIDGGRLHELIVRGEGSNAATRPSPLLDELVGKALDGKQSKQLAIAIGSLLRKGYFSTVGAVKVEGSLTLAASSASANGPAASAAARECSLVDFAGQMEYLVSHQLLLASMHTLIMVIQPASSFSQPEHRHHGSWRYWLKFLRALGERRTGSLLLAVSQLDRVGEGGEGLAAAEAALAREHAALRSDELGDGQPPLRLDYRAGVVEGTMSTVRERLSQAADAVARDWWVPASYERLAETVRRLGQERHAARALPIVSRDELRATLAAEDDEALQTMASDPLLLRRGVEYLEAVGDALIDDRLDCLLLDPVGWFASFLAHFIRDDGNPPAELVRGVVSLRDVIKALRHDYEDPDEQVPEVMALVVQLELCVRLSEANGEPESAAAAAAEAEEEGGESSFLFPCLLPAASSQELATHWPHAPSTEGASASGGAPHSSSAVLRGHRFRAALGFVPPGLFPTLIARLVRLPTGCVHSTRLWSNAAVLAFRHARVLLRLDSEAATLDIVGAAPVDAAFFVGAAKGQASIVKWMAHLVKRFLKRAYGRIEWDESWLCPSPRCHGLELGSGGPTAIAYTGAEFPLRAASKGVVKSGAAEHVCEEEGCWGQLGTGHKLDPMVLVDETAVCATCGVVPAFPLRAGGQFGWTSAADARLMARGFAVSRPAETFAVPCAK